MEKYKAYVADPAIDQEAVSHDEKSYPHRPVIWIENQELLGALRRL